MVRKLMTAALILTLGLTAAGCGGTNTSTAAHRWNNQNNALVQQNEARGPLDDRTDGTYSADGSGRVNGYNTEGYTGSSTLTTTGRGLANAGEDLTRGATDAARSVGDAVEDTLDGMTGTGKTTTK